MSRRIVPALLLLFLAISCRRDESRLDDVQKMVYSVKPAVVRISAYATAEFHYPNSALQPVASDLGVLSKIKPA
ncbi:MAG TPA: hypothetical protein VJ853_10485, partial [Thermoanaerobaculia bacterium]|nr:hypothetical protein [Thermoanaerobaculia bacterium]